jgi:3-hydroxybutyryl-CoA dehydrogenase
MEEEAEIIRGHPTSDETLKIGKEVVIVKDAPAFVVNQILCTMINSAFLVFD